MNTDLVRDVKKEEKNHYFSKPSILFVTKNYKTEHFILKAYCKRGTKLDLYNAEE